jgi:transposase-like protein
MSTQSDVSMGPFLATPSCQGKAALLLDTIAAAAAVAAATAASVKHKVQHCEHTMITTKGGSAKGATMPTCKGRMCVTTMPSGAHKSG